MIQIQGRTESCEGRGINNIVWTIDIGGIDCGLGSADVSKIQDGGSTGQKVKRPRWKKPF